MQKRITGCQIRASNLNSKGSPLSRPGFADVCGRLRSLLALRQMSAAVCSLSSHFAGCLRPFALRLRTLVDVCGRLRSPFALCRMSAAICSLSSHFCGCLRPFVRPGLKVCNSRYFKASAAFPGLGGVNCRKGSLVVKFVLRTSTSRGPLFRGSVLRMSAAVCVPSSHFVGCLRPFACPSLHLASSCVKN